MEEAQASIKNFSGLMEWVGQEEEQLATAPEVPRQMRGEPKILQRNQVTGDSSLPGRLAMGIGRSPTQFQKDLQQQSVKRRGRRHTSMYSSDASNWNTLNRADDWERSHKRGVEHLRHHNYESTEPSTDKMETSDEWSESESRTWTRPTAQEPGMVRTEVSLPDLNEKSTANDAWIWHTNAEQYLRDGYIPRVVKAKMLRMASQEPGEWL